MKRITITICTAALLFACKSEVKKADDQKDDTKVAAAATESKHEALPDSVMMKNWEQYMTPGKEHQMMASWDGEWSGNVTMWNSPGTAPSTSNMEATNKMVMGGRYQQSNITGTMMGKPFEGMSTMGFDNAKKEFFSTWVDNMGTGVLMTTGKWDDASKSITFTGKSTDPTTLKDYDFKEVVTVPDNDHQLMEMYGPGPDGKEFKSVEIRLTRKK
jgi:hypothetical protein